MHVSPGLFLLFLRRRLLTLLGTLGLCSRVYYSAHVSARVLSMFRVLGIDKTVEHLGRQAGRQAPSFERERRKSKEKEKSSMVENVAESAESCHCGYQTDCSRPNRIRVCGRRGQQKQIQKGNRPDLYTVMQSLAHSLTGPCLSSMGPPGPPLFFSTAIRLDLPNSHVPGWTHASWCGTDGCKLIIMKRTKGTQVLSIPPRGIRNPHLITRLATQHFGPASAALLAENGNRQRIFFSKSEMAGSRDR